MKRIMTALALGLLAIASPASADPTFLERGRAPVVDAANVIPADQELALNQQLSKVYETTKRQVVVATVPSLEGLDIETYAYKYFRFLRLGDRTTNDGVLVIVSTGDKKTRIEVGYGLEPFLTDSESGEIVDNIMLPAFRKDANGVRHWAEGLQGAVNAILPQISPDAQQKVLEQQKIDNERSMAFWNGVEDFFTWTAIIVGGVVFTVFIGWLITAPARRRKREEEEQIEREERAAAEQRYRDAVRQQQLREQERREAAAEAERKVKQQREDMLNAMTPSVRKAFLAKEQQDARDAAERQRERDRAAAKVQREADQRAAARREEARSSHDYYSSPTPSYSSPSPPPSPTYSSDSDGGFGGFDGGGGSSGGGGASGTFD